MYAIRSYYGFPKAERGLQRLRREELEADVRRRHGRSFRSAPCARFGDVRQTHNPQEGYEFLCKMHLEFRHLRTIKAIHDAGGLARAADILHITQSALSHQVKGLEDQTGIELFA